MRPTRLVLYVASLPTDLIGWSIVAILNALWGSRSAGPRWDRGALLVRLARDSWAGRKFAAWGGVTFGHAIAAFDDQPQSTLDHEQVHVEQIEGGALLGLIAGASVAWWAWPLALALWVTMPWLTYLVAGLTALLRGESFYRGNASEEAAYDAAAAGRKPI